MAISQAQIQKYVISMAIALLALYVVANYTSQATCDNFGLTYKGT